MRRLEEVPREELKDLLGKGWLTHDGMWFYHTYLDSGMERANRINRQAIRSLAAIEMARARKVLQVEDEDLRSFKGLQRFMHDSLQMTLPESVFSRSIFTFIPPTCSTGSGRKASASLTRRCSRWGSSTNMYAG